MHIRLYNEAIFTLSMRPRTPLLIKAGRSGEEALDPTLPAMAFVRTNRPDRPDPEVFVPGASLRGVLRSHSERLVRSVGVTACDPTRTQARGAQTELLACFAGESNTDAIDGPAAYRRSCPVCRIFGNTMLAARLRISDFTLTGKAVLDRRYGVSIDRVTGSVANGPFDIEIMTDGVFAGQLSLRNFTVGQFGLIAGALLDLSDGLVPLGYGKSRGLGQVMLTFTQLKLRTLRDPQGDLCGIGNLAIAKDREVYDLPKEADDRMPLAATVTRDRGFYIIESGDGIAREWLKHSVERWVKEFAP